MAKLQKSPGAVREEEALDKLMEEILLAPAAEPVRVSPGRLEDWLDPVVRVILEEARSGLDDRGTMVRIAEEWGLDPEVVLAEAVAREVRKELARRVSRAAEDETGGLGASFYSTYQLVETYLKAIRAASKVRRAGKDSVTQAAFDILGDFFMPGKHEIAEINLQPGFDALVSDSERISDEVLKPRDERLNEAALALDMAREHGCLVPPGDKRKALETLRAAAKKYRSESSHVDRMVKLEEEVRKLIRRRVRSGGVKAR
ncbi:MAG: hypothetical protein IT186_20120 [Acidobacteria bacterium]|nr:hypothetical protein [Acidobacteriota bacterium]MCG3194124.1 hypothetical protein [Thermoanaerobaculia bacterium]MCK6680861.1 hypothetical protein [Thermoanaerobaculia bacterium]